MIRVEIISNEIIDGQLKVSCHLKGKLLVDSNGIFSSLHFKIGLSHYYSKHCADLRL